MQWDRAQGDRDSVFQTLDSAASSELLGRPVLSTDELRNELVNVTVPAAREVVRNAVTTALVTVPAGVEVHDAAFAPYPTWSTDTVGGHHFTAASQRFPWSPKKNTLWVAPEGVSVVTPDRHAATVLFDACEGVIKRGDAELVVHGADGFMIHVRADDWDNGRRALKEIVTFAPADLVLQLPD
jgi:hypothetical protein